MSSIQYAIFQLKEDSPKDLRALPYPELLKRHKHAYIANYSQTYTGKAGSPDPNLIMHKLSRRLPEGFTGHPIEVGDVIAIKQDGGQSAYYVDSADGKLFLVVLPGFFTKADHIDEKKNINRGVEQHSEQDSGPEAQSIEAPPDPRKAQKHDSVWKQVALNQEQMQHIKPETKSKHRAASKDR